MINIAIDGPSGAGKSSISKEVAKKLGIVYVDTGALYRSIGLYFYKNNISPQTKKNTSRSFKWTKKNMKQTQNY